MERRRLGRLGHESSVIIYGGFALAAVDQDEADRSVQQALDAGINHFDVAASYGDAEERLGPWTARLGPDAFLATKTGERSRDAAWAEIERSLERLRVPRVDLLQLHAVGDLDELDQVMAPGGALEAVLRARDEGLTVGVGITGHGHQAPATHLEALRRFPFDTVLTPWNHALARDPAFRADFLALVAECQRQDVGLMTIKAVARRNYPEGAAGGYHTWYQPWDDPEHLAAAVAFALRQPGVTGFAAAGDTRLLGPIVAAAEAAAALSDEEVDRVLSSAPDYSSPFLNMPF
ncbi:MAG: aldo/keto reductase [Actinomycetia bacterium]|jgi:aryl-alcohol dehydrogenase-like predicted oxidoreductase|nr:aldo/keto reductase [Actinomycetes bacterium]